jgi:hypothetical protein
MGSAVGCGKPLGTSISAKPSTMQIVQIMHEHG